MAIKRTGFMVCCLLLLAACKDEIPPVVPTATPTQPASTRPPTPLPTPRPDSPSGFEAFLARAADTRRDERQDLVNRYTALLAASPLTSSDEAIFLWRGEAFTVQLVGDMNNWDLSLAPALERLEGTDLWYLKASYEPEARFDYQFVVDGEEWRMDPLNPRSVSTRLGPRSEMLMPAYPMPPELLPQTDVTATGNVTSHTIASEHLNQTRTFFVYTPPGQLVGGNLPSVYVNDGGDYMNLIDAPTILDRLIVNRQIPPVVAVFIPPISRNLEYGLEDDYVDFLAEELVPFMRERYGTDPDPATTAVLGSSAGGLAAAYAAVARPDVFGMAASQSGTFSFKDDLLIQRMLAEQDTGGAIGRQTRWYLVVGTYETAVEGNGSENNLLEANRRFVATLRDFGDQFQYDERPEGHSWGLWRGTLGHALTYLFNG